MTPSSSRGPNNEEGGLGCRLASWIFKKLDFYATVATQELLVIHPDPWRLEIYRQAGESMQRAAVASVASEDVVHCNIVPIDCTLIEEQCRPRIRVDHRESSRSWTI